ncbi:hypothetical protein [Mycobacterium kyogaense]|uniref:hypothetical protein n=1 Tax=Mycobacterium kyogaense TaxID=2212479 RepID=UPI000DAB6054|nr:hypothetical protein [Mycobacterium kyogaense]
MTDYHAGMLAAIPGYTEQTARVRTLKRWHTAATDHISEVQTDDQLRDDMVNLLTTSAAHEDVNPPDLSPLILAHENGRSRAMRALNAHAAALDNAERALESIRNAGTEHALDYLEEQLDTLKAQWSKLDMAAAPKTAEAAIDADRVKEYRTVDGFVRSYFDFRAAHRALLSIDARGHGTGNFTTQLALVGQMRDHIDAEPEWARRRLVAAKSSTAANPIARSHVEWLSAAPQPIGDRGGPSTQNYLVPSGVTAAQWVDHVFQHDVWVPNADQLVDAFELAMRACRPQVDNEVAGLLQARYYRARGAAT